MTQQLDIAPVLHRVQDILDAGALRAHYQPIVQLKDGRVIAHESLVRMPANSALRTPDDFFRAARSDGLTVKAEQACLDVGIRYWATHKPDTRLFLNLSAFAIIEMVDRLTVAGLMRALHAASISPSALVVEITEHEHVADLPRLVATAAELRTAGLRFALDDFGDGRSSLRLWAELRPEIVKIDKYFIHDVATEPVKVQTLRGLTRLAETFGTTLVAEGIETEDELRVVRDLGIELGQGWFLGRPQPVPAMSVLRPAGETIISSEIAVLPEITRAAGADFTVERLALDVPPLPSTISIEELARHLAADPALRAVALVDGGTPVGLINRQTFVDSYARPYFKELYGRKPCITFANTTPLVLDKHTGLDGMTAVLTSSDQRYLTEGFIVTEGGRYLGLGTGEQLVRVVTEVRIEAARHANPLTFLPGNIPLTQHIERLLKSGANFVACYADLNHFKPFNDRYGYWRGDEMLRLLSRTAVEHCDQRRDFVGHVGGDDFVILFQSEDWRERCEMMVNSFNDLARQLFDAEAMQAGGFEAEDRYGDQRFFPLTTLSIGAVKVEGLRPRSAEQIASQAALVKHVAKSTGSGLVVRNAAIQA